MSRLAPAVRFVTRASTAGIFRGDLPIEVRRARLERATRTMPRPCGVDLLERRLGDRRALLARPHGADAGRAVLYLHGGSFVAGSPETHAGLGARLARAAGCDVWILDYRLAPECPFPAGFDDAFAAYRQLREDGGRHLAIAGDSAGGGLALTTTLALRDAGAPLPEALLLLAPWLDLTLSGDTVRTGLDAEIMLDPDTIAGDASAYAGSEDPARLRAVSPLFAELAGLPPTLVQVGGRDILLADAERFAQHGSAAGNLIELQQYPEMWHVWHSAAPFLPEANTAITACGAWLRAAADVRAPGDVTRPVTSTSGGAEPHPEAETGPPHPAT